MFHVILIGYIHLLTSLLPSLLSDFPGCSVPHRSSPLSSIFVPAELSQPEHIWPKWHPSWGLPLFLSPSLSLSPSVSASPSLTLSLCLSPPPARSSCPPLAPPFVSPPPSLSVSLSLSFSLSLSLSVSLSL